MNRSIQRSVARGTVHTGLADRQTKAEDLTDFVVALVLGFVVAVPIGPVSLLCVQRTLALGRIAGLATGAGVALADAAYSFLAAGILGFVGSQALADRPWLHWVAGIVLITLGVAILVRPPKIRETKVSDETIILCLVSGFVLTLTNPVAPVLMVTGFAVSGLAETDMSPFRSILIATGIFLGSMAWWFLLVLGTRFVKGQMPPSVTQWMNRAVGVSFLIFGGIAVWTGIS